MVELRFCILTEDIQGLTVFMEGMSALANTLPPGCKLRFFVVDYDDICNFMDKGIHAVFTSYHIGKGKTGVDLKNKLDLRGDDVPVYSMEDGPNNHKKLTEAGILDGFESEESDEFIYRIVRRNEMIKETMLDIETEDVA